MEFIKSIKLCYALPFERLSKINLLCKQKSSRISCCGHTAIFLLHRLSKTSKCLTILAHNLIFQYDSTFAARNFYSISTSKSFVFVRNLAEFYAQFYSSFREVLYCFNQTDFLILLVCANIQQ